MEKSFERETISHKVNITWNKLKASALYVIDLKRFRQFSAGDRLRGQYQALSSDPNSLANLDQDLPNNMIHEIPMFSLPNGLNQINSPIL